MDIDHLIASHIVPTQYDICSVQFPSFSGYCEVAICRHNNINIKYGENELSPFFRCEDISHDIHQIILASRIANAIAVRIINADFIYTEELFLIQEGEIFSVQLIGKHYFVFIYYDLDKNIKIASNIPKDSIFTYQYIGSVFSIINTLTETSVFEKEIIFHDAHKDTKNNEEVFSDYTLIVAEEIFSRKIGSFLKKLTKLSGIESREIDSDLYLVRFEHIQRMDLMRIVGFLGQYICILPEKLVGLSGYMTEEAATDSHFSLPEQFSGKTSIDYYDPNWHSLRLGVLEIFYFSYLLKKHIGYLENGITDITNLEDKRVEFQKIHMNMTLSSAKEIYPKYLQQYQILIDLLKNQIS